MCLICRVCGSGCCASRCGNPELCKAVGGCDACRSYTEYEEWNIAVGRGMCIPCSHSYNDLAEHTGLAGAALEKDLQKRIANPPVVDRCPSGRCDYPKGMRRDIDIVVFDDVIHQKECRTSVKP